jgi:hypothetical protein
MKEPRYMARSDERSSPGSSKRLTCAIMRGHSRRSYTGVEYIDVQGDYQQ